MDARSAFAITMGLTLAGCQMSDADPTGARVDEATARANSAGETAPAAQPPAPASTGCDAGVWEGDYVVLGQSDLDALAGYTEVTGTIHIEDTDLVHLVGPACLVAVGGSVVLYENVFLESVTGFDGLHTIDGSLAMGENRSLTAISGFGELRSAGSLVFDSNGFETVIAGFDELRTVAGDVQFVNGHFQIFGFDELELIEDTLLVWNGNGPDGKNISIRGMNELSTVGGIRVEGMGQVALDGLGALERVDSNVVFERCRIVDTRGLSALSRIDGDLLFDYDDYIARSIIDFPALEHLDGHFIIESGVVELGAFSDLEFIGGDLRFDETDVHEIIGFNDLEIIGGTFAILDCPLERLVGFDDVQEIGGDVILDEVEGVLIELAIFDELESVGGTLELKDNDLVSLSMFDDLRSIGGDLLVYRNRVLASLGFPDLEFLGGGSLLIDRNDALSTCEAEALLRWCGIDRRQRPLRVAQKCTCAPARSASRASPRARSSRDQAASCMGTALAQEPISTRRLPCSSTATHTTDAAHRPARGWHASPVCSRSSSSATRSADGVLYENSIDSASCSCGRL